MNDREIFFDTFLKQYGYSIEYYNTIVKLKEATDFIFKETLNDYNMELLLCPSVINEDIELNKHWVKYLVKHSIEYKTFTRFLKENNVYKQYIIECNHSNVMLPPSSCLNPHCFFYKILLTENTLFNKNKWKTLDEQWNMLLTIDGFSHTHLTWNLNEINHGRFN